MKPGAKMAKQIQHKAIVPRNPVPDCFRRNQPRVMANVTTTSFKTINSGRRGFNNCGVTSKCHARKKKHKPKGNTPAPGKTAEGKNVSGKIKRRANQCFCPDCEARETEYGGE